ncbi:hypothetical protein [Pusillimonas caeni]
MAAIRGTIHGLMIKVLEGQIREHIAAAGLSAAEREQGANQLAKVL